MCHIKTDICINAILKYITIKGMLLKSAVLRPWANSPAPVFLWHICCTVYSVFDIFSSSYLMAEYRWKVTLLSEGMLIWNCQQLFWRIPWLLWSLHPTGCPNFDTESHGCSYLYILWENRFPPCNRFFFFSFSPARLSLQLGHATEMGAGAGVIMEKTHKTGQSVSNSYVLLFYVVIFLTLLGIVGATSQTLI